MRHEIAFYLTALLTLASATAAMRLRSVVHCALCGALAFAGLALCYLLLDAEFVAFAQFLVYVGAVAVLLVFGIMLTRGGEIGTQAAIVSGKAWLGIAVAFLLCAVLTVASILTFGNKTAAVAVASAPVRAIGESLMGRHIVALEALGLLLTASLIGAMVVANREGTPTNQDRFETFVPSPRDPSRYTSTRRVPLDAKPPKPA
jgi:NADH-quinone oxidoreductase subunit J